MSNNKKDIKPWSIVCPICKDNRAYQGFMAIECPNVFCKNFTEKQETLVLEYVNKDAKKIDDNDLIDLPPYDDSDDTNDNYSDGLDQLYGFGQLP